MGHKMPILAMEPIKPIMGTMIRRLTFCSPDSQLAPP